jgi:uncharacterized repeat protein (TIGR03803 family)
MREYARSTTGLRNLPIYAVILSVSVVAAAQHERVLYAFGTQSGDGRLPDGALIADAAGNFYGMTGSGGASEEGTVYELSPPTAPAGSWTETVIYTFSGNEDGGGPFGALVFDAVGNLYGTTSSGGNLTCLEGCGTVFELSPPATQGQNWTETTIYTFDGADDGGVPDAGLIFDQAGNLYGTTSVGGGIGSCDGSAGSGCGSVFELSPPATTWERLDRDGSIQFHRRKRRS